MAKPTPVPIQDLAKLLAAQAVKAYLAKAQKASRPVDDTHIPTVSNPPASG